MARKNTQVDYVKTALRLPPELHERVHASAKESGRTYNAELISRLEASFNAERRESLIDIALAPRPNTIVGELIFEAALRKMPTTALEQFDQALKESHQEALSLSKEAKAEIARREAKKKGK